MTTGNQVEQGSGMSSPSAVIDRPIGESGSSTRLLLCLGLAMVLIPAIYQWLVHVVITFAPGTNGIYDFSVYYAAALALRDNAHANIYNPDVLRAAAQAHHAYLMPVSTLYLYPPLLAILMIPLTLISQVSATHVWLICNALMWLGGTFLLADLLQFMFVPQGTSSSVDRLPPSAGRRRWSMGSVIAWVSQIPDATLFAYGIAFTLSLLNSGLEESVSIGQVSLLVFFLLVLAPWLDRRGRPGLAGAVLALAALIKIFPIVLIGYYVLRGNWRVVRGAALGFAVLVIGMVAYIGLPGVLATREILTNGASSGTQYQNEALARLPFWVSVLARHELHRVATYAGDALIALVLLAFIGGVIATTVLARRHRGSQAGRATATRLTPEGLLGYGWALATMVLISPVTWEHHLAWLLPACLFSVGYTLRLFGGAWRRDATLLKRELTVLALLMIGYALVSHTLPFSYDGAVQFNPGPYIAHVIPLRPVFMISRPLGGLLIWLATGFLLLLANRRERASAGHQAAVPAAPAAVSMNTAADAAMVID